jgi:D-galactosamine 6-phosphate deaminase/isomerase
MRRADAADDRPNSALPPEPLPEAAEGTGATSGQLAEPLRELAGQPAEVQQRLGYTDTLREICQQPATWRETSSDIAQQAPHLAAFLREAGVLDRSGALILTGSGSSLYAGASVGPALQAALGIAVHVVAAGDILTHPQQVLPPTRPWLAVSFARSGNSPESTATVNLMWSRDPECRHLLVTCCRTGRLATSFSDDPRVLSVVLNERTCDRSLVMTSSFTNMVIAASILGSLDDTERYRQRVAALSQAADHLLGCQVQPLADLARRSFRAVVFLGVGCRYGGAREASLKLTEMSDGLVLSFAETYLGLRHGPMSAIREDTLVVCFLSSDPTARAFEVDLVSELNRKRLGAGKVLIGEAVPGDLAAEGDLVVEYPGMAALGDDSAPVLDVLAAQLLGFFRCLHLGLRPDSPSASGVINRVVGPFTIHRES